MLHRSFYVQIGTFQMINRFRSAAKALLKTLLFDLMSTFTDLFFTLTKKRTCVPDIE